METENQKNIIPANEHFSSEETVQVVTFKLNDEEFGLDILKILEINKIIKITKIPKAPDFVEGIIDLRGKIIPVVNIRKKFNFETKKTTKETRIIITNIINKTIGLMVDKVSEILRIKNSEIQPPPPLITKLGSEHIKGVGKLNERLIILLDIDKIFEKSEYEIIQNIK